MRIPSSVEYAARIAVRLAREGCVAGLPGGKTLSAEKLSELEKVPRDYVDQLLLRLRRAGLVLSRRGAQGGYCLALPLGRISAGQVVRAVDHGIFESVCERYAEGESTCAHVPGCGIRPIWRKLGTLVEEFLDQVTLDQLLGEEGVVDSRIAGIFGPEAPAPRP